MAPGETGAGAGAEGAGPSPDAGLLPPEGAAAPLGAPPPGAAPPEGVPWAWLACERSHGATSESNIGATNLDFMISFRGGGFAALLRSWGTCLSGRQTSFVPARVSRGAVGRGRP